MQIEEALKLVNAHFVVQNFLTRYNYLFSDGAFKVINVLLSQVNYRLDNTMCAISYPELAKKLRKKKGAIENYINELINKQFIVKTSGKYAKTLARYQKGQIYQQKQAPTRSFNEKNIYDLRNLIILTAMHHKLSNIYTQHSDGIDYIVEYIIHTTEKTHIPIEDLISPIMFTSEECPAGICFTNIDNIDEISIIRKSDFHNKEISNDEISIIRKSDFHNKEISNDEISIIRKSDFHNKEKSISIELNPKIEDIHNYTHSLRQEKNESEREENQNTKREKEKNRNNKEVSTNTFMHTHGNNTTLDDKKNFSYISQTQNASCDEDKRFWLFMWADLRRKERTGMIRSAEAVLASLVSNPDKIDKVYRIKYQEYLAKVQEAQLCVIKFPQSMLDNIENSLLSYIFEHDDIELMIDEKLSNGAMVYESANDMYVMVMSEVYYNNCIERMREVSIESELVKDDYLQYEHVFISRVLDVFFPHNNKQYHTQRKNKNIYYHDGYEEETYHG